MERQRSFIVKPTRLYFLFFIISFSILFFLLFSFLLLSTSSSSQTHHLQFNTGGLNTIKTHTFIALATNSSENETSDPILRDAHVGQLANSPEQYPLSQGEDVELEDGILNHTHVINGIGSYEEGLDLVEEGKIAGFGVSNSKVRDYNERFEVSSNGSLLNVSENVSRNEGESGCDVSDGSWVFDESYPGYTNNSCPFIDEGFSCESNGRLDGRFMKWRWQPHQCTIPRFNPVKFLELIRGKRLVFAGDSINRNQWESLLCLLRGAIRDPSRVYEARGRKITKTRGNYNFKFIDYQCSVEYYVSHFLVQESKARVGQRRVKTLKIDAIDKSSSRWRGADILVFNTAHWWSHYKTKSGVNYYQEGNLVHPRLNVSTAFRKALTTWASWVNRYVTPGKTRVFFRSSSPSHFRGGEWNSGGHCRESTQPLNDSHVRIIPEKNQILEEVVKQMRTPVTILNITGLSGLRIDGHPSIYGKKPAKGTPSSVEDCSHWCLPGVPDTWNELLYFYLLLSKNS